MAAGAWRASAENPASGSFSSGILVGCLQDDKHGSGERRFEKKQIPRRAKDGPSLGMTM